MGRIRLTTKPELFAEDNGKLWVVKDKDGRVIGKYVSLNVAKFYACKHARSYNTLWKGHELMVWKMKIQSYEKVMEEV